MTQKRLLETIEVQYAHLEGKMTRTFSVIIERDTEGYYVGTIPELRGCHSQARSLDELMIRVREAAELCLEAQMDGLEPLDFVGIQTISVAL
jgi:predicted RNase H-like HicB family nuclease